MFKLFRYFFARLLFTGIIFIATPSIAAVFNATVVKVIDGDSIIVRSGLKSTEVRLAGIDAPEYSQNFGNNCRIQLKNNILGKNVQLKTINKDRYGRTVAVIYLANRNINREIVANGCAWAYRKYLNDNSLIGLEQQARRKKYGLWSQNNPMPPWQYRQHKKHKY